jgi:hypothetical protein
LYHPENSRKHWYVYIVKIGAEFSYVGKGAGYRWLTSAKRLGGMAGIVEFFPKERDALARERELIAAYQPRLNKTAGGEGRSKKKIKRNMDAYWFRKNRQEAYQAADKYGSWWRWLCAAAWARCVLNDKGIKVEWPAVVPDWAQGDPEVVEAVRRLNVWHRSTPPVSLHSPICSQS